MNKAIREYRAMKKFCKRLFKDNHNIGRKEIWAEYLSDYWERMKVGQFIFIGNKSGR